MQRFSCLVWGITARSCLTSFHLTSFPSLADAFQSVAYGPNDEQWPSLQAAFDECGKLNGESKQLCRSPSNELRTTADSTSTFGSGTSCLTSLRSSSLTFPDEAHRRDRRGWSMDTIQVECRSPTVRTVLQSRVSRAHWERFRLQTYYQLESQSSTLDPRTPLLLLLDSAFLTAESASENGRKRNPGSFYLTNSNSSFGTRLSISDPSSYSSPEGWCGFWR